MKIHFLSSDALETLRSNLTNNISNYKKPANEWIFELFDGKNPFLEYKTEVKDFKLYFDENKPVGELEVENAIVLYSAMNNISDTQASDERLWSGMCHSDLWEYLHHRWYRSNTGTLKESEIKTRYFFAHNHKRSLITNPISRLWWLGRLTYDNKRSDPFELTKYFKKDYTHKLITIFSRNYTGNFEILRGLISALIDLEKSGLITTSTLKEYEDLFLEAARYLNVLGGMYILDYFSSQEIHDKVIRHIIAYQNNK